MGKKYKMTTDIPENITAPDQVETRLGTWNFSDRLPDEATVDNSKSNFKGNQGH